jgi:hypothetical protein
VETIRQYLKRRNRMLKAITYTGLGAIVVYGLLHEEMTHLQLSEIAFVGSLAVALIALIAVRVIYPFACPQCGKGLGNRVPRKLVQKVVRDMNSKGGLGACPHCGTSFDVPMPHKLIS